MGFFATLIMPVLMFVILARSFGAGPRLAAPEIGIAFNAAVLAAVIIAINAVQSLMAIMAIYREGGILKRLRATPLSPVTILGAHVMVKLGFTVLSTALLLGVGRRLFPGVTDVNAFSFGLAVLLSTLSILSLGFVLASLVPTSRFAQPLGAVVL
jgi:ABC-2 type transport system permease protein